MKDVEASVSNYGLESCLVGIGCAKFLWYLLQLLVHIRCLFVGML